MAFMAFVAFGKDFFGPEFFGPVSDSEESVFSIIYALKHRPYEHYIENWNRFCPMLLRWFESSLLHLVTFQWVGWLIHLPVVRPEALAGLFHEWNFPSTTQYNMSFVNGPPGLMSIRNVMPTTVETNQFVLGLMNSPPLAFSISTTTVFCFRWLCVEYVRWGALLAFFGNFLGNWLVIVAVLFGLDDILAHWYFLTPLTYVGGIFFIWRLIWTWIRTGRRFDAKIIGPFGIDPVTWRGIKMGVTGFTLGLTEQTVLFQKLIQPLSPEQLHLLHGFSSGTVRDHMLMHGSYVAGLFVGGFLLGSFVLAILVRAADWYCDQTWMSDAKLLLPITIMTGISIPYYGLDYVIARFPDLPLNEGWEINTIFRPVMRLIKVEKDDKHDERFYNIDVSRRDYDRPWLESQTLYPERKWVLKVNKVKRHPYLAVKDFLTKFQPGDKYTPKTGAVRGELLLKMRSLNKGENATSEETQEAWSLISKHFYQWTEEELSRQQFQLAMKQELTNAQYRMIRMHNVYKTMYTMKNGRINAEEIAFPLKEHLPADIPLANSDFTGAGAVDELFDWGIIETQEKKENRKKKDKKDPKAVTKRLKELQLPFEAQIEAQKQLLKSFEEPKTGLSKLQALTELQAVKNELERQIKEELSKLEPPKNKLEEDLSNVDLSKIDVDLSKITAPKIKIDADLSKLRADISKIKADMSELEAPSTDIKIAVELTKLEADRDKIKAKLNKLETPNKKIDVDLNKARADLSKLKADLSKLKADRSELETPKRKITSLNKIMWARISDVEVEKGRLGELNETADDITSEMELLSKWNYMRARFWKGEAYSNLMFKRLMDLEVDLILLHQPSRNFITDAEHKRLQYHQVALAAYHRGLRSYDKSILASMLDPRGSILKNKLLLSDTSWRSDTWGNWKLGWRAKSLENYVYAQQFKGSQRIIQRLFLLDLPWNPWDGPTFRYDQLLPLEDQDKGDRSNLWHEEVPQSIREKVGAYDPFQSKRVAPMFDPVPFYIGWDSKIRKSVLTTTRLPIGSTRVKLVMPVIDVLPKWDFLGIKRFLEEIQLYECLELLADKDHEFLVYVKDEPDLKAEMQAEMKNHKTRRQDRTTKEEREVIHAPSSVRINPRYRMIVPGQKFTTHPSNPYELELQKQLKKMARDAKKAAAHAELLKEGGGADEYSKHKENIKDLKQRLSMKFKGAEKLRLLNVLSKPLVTPKSPTVSVSLDSPVTWVKGVSDSNPKVNIIDELSDDKSESNNESDVHDESMNLTTNN